MVANGPNETTWRVLDIALTVIIAIVLALSGWNLKTTVDIGQELSAMKASQFTSSDGLRVWKEIAEIREQMAGFPNEIPPPWFKSEVDELKLAVRDMERRLARVEAKLQ